MVIKEDVDKAKAAEATAYLDACRTRYAATQAAAEAAAWDVKATAADAAAEAAWDKYTKLKEEYENGIKSTED
jgi:hypothetical protein